MAELADALDLGCVTSQKLFAFYRPLCYNFIANHSKIPYAGVAKLANAVGLGPTGSIPAGSSPVARRHFIESELMFL